MSLNVRTSSLTSDVVGSPLPATNVAEINYVVEASVQLLAGGWTVGLAEHMVVLGQPSFIEAIQDKIDPSLALKKALLHGRHMLLTEMLEKDLADGIELRVAFKSLLALTRQNTMRAGNFDMVYPRAWVYAALEAVESAAALNATPGNMVLVGFNVFSAAASGTRDDVAAAERADAAHRGQDPQEPGIHGDPETM